MADSDSPGNDEAFLSNAEGYSDFYVVEKQYLAGKSTVLIDYSTGAGEMIERGGTGTLLPNGWILTCRHVIRDKQQAANARIYFDYRRDGSGQIPSQNEGLELAPELGFQTKEDGLDWVLVKLKDHTPQAFPFYVAPLDNPKLQVGQKLTIFQFPYKHYLKFAQGDCSNISNGKVYYSIDTDRGSSGGPVLNDAGDLVAIHKADKDSSSNQGVPFKAIIDELRLVAPDVWDEMLSYVQVHPVSFASIREKIPQYINLPAVLSLFKGRDEDILKIRAALSGSESVDTKGNRGCVVFGLGGIGKTRLVVEYARRYRNQYSSILFVEARSVESLRANIANLCEFLEIREPEPSRRLSRVRGWLGENFGWLLIVDNVDDDDTSIEVENLVADLPNGQVLFTSRLNTWQNKGFRPIELLKINRVSSVEIILEGTDQKRKTEVSDQEDANSLAELLGDLPLALQQAVGFVSSRHCSIDDYLTRWKSTDSKVLEWHNEATLKYKRSVATTWELTFEALKPEGQEALRIICWLAPDPIPRALFDKVPHEPEPFDVEEGIAELEKYSFLRWVELGNPFVQVHGLVSDITRYRMNASEREASLSKAIDTAEAFLRGSDPQDPRNWVPLYKPCREHFSSLIRHAEVIRTSAQLANLMNDFGVYLTEIAEFDKAELLLRRALGVREASFGPDHPDVVLSLINLAFLLSKTNRNSEAELLYRRSLSICENSTLLDATLLATSMNNLASLLSKTNRRSEAEPLYRRALSILEASLGPDHPDVASSLNNLALLLFKTNHIREAEPLYRRALSILEASLGPNHPNVATSLNNLASLLSGTNRKEEAEPLYRQSLRIWEITFGPDHPDVAISLNNLALLLSETNRKNEAEPLFRRALGIWEASLGTDHPIVATSLGNLALLLSETDRKREAEPLYRRSLRMKETSLGPDHPDVALSLNNLALLLYQTNRKNESELLYRRALRIRETSLGPDHPYVASTLSTLAKLLSGTNRINEAEPMYRRALGILIAFRASTGHTHPNFELINSNYSLLLTELGNSPEQIAQTLDDIKNEIETKHG
jgi:tetratricopeptide (TPR) repeat protein/V8-like Glu-specific endopeptidase